MIEDKYYGDGVYEAIKVIQAHKLDFNYGNIVKYALRAGKKRGATKVEDTVKIFQYAVFAICQDVIEHGGTDDIVAVLHKKLNEAIFKFFAKPEEDEPAEEDARK